MAAASVGSGTPARWSYATLGSAIGQSGIVTARNGDGTEIYVGGSTGSFTPNDRWHALRYSQATASYEQVFVSEHLPQGIRRIVLAQVTRSGPPRLVVALLDGTMLVYDQRSKVLLSRDTGPCFEHGGLEAFDVADLDDNRTHEFIASCADQTLHVGGTGYAAWSLSNVGGTDLAVGQMDDDPALEIATTSGYVIDTASRAVQWQRTTGFGVHLQAADIDADGRDELIAADVWSFVRAYDVESQQLKWTIPTDRYDGAILVTDLDGDGIKELLTGDGLFTGEIQAYNTTTLKLEWTIHNPDPQHGVTNFAMADFDNDGSTKLVWAGGATSSVIDHLYVADWRTRTILWQSEATHGPSQIGDLDNDGARVRLATMGPGPGRNVTRH